ncbi:LASP1 protein, partial [Ramphastos sulfuratus]|nr:LASP1 protein [Ramphastos sulfuratus]
LCAQIRYKEEFEKNKGKGFSVVADTPELQRIKKTQDQISNVSGLQLSACGHRDDDDGDALTFRLTAAKALPPSPLLCSLPHQHRRLQQPGLAYQQHQQQPPPQSYSYKEPAVPSSTQRSAPSAGGKRFRAVYDYTAADEDEVSFQDGDTIINVQQIDDGWMYGTVERTGDTGMLPANYVEAI